MLENKSKSRLDLPFLFFGLFFKLRTLTPALNNNRQKLNKILNSCRIKKQDQSLACCLAVSLRPASCEGKVEKCLTAISVSAETISCL